MDLRKKRFVGSRGEEYRVTSRWPNRSAAEEGRYTPRPIRKVQESSATAPRPIGGHEKRAGSTLRGRAEPSRAEPRGPRRDFPGEDLYSVESLVAVWPVKRMVSDRVAHRPPVTIAFSFSTSGRRPRPRLRPAAGSREMPTLPWIRWFTSEQRNPSDSAVPTQTQTLLGEAGALDAARRLSSSSEARRREGSPARVSAAKRRGWRKERLRRALSLERSREDKRWHEPRDSSPSLPPQPSALDVTWFSWGD
ncbi:hypothetical protein AGIG_G18166 [Arapaima gigas]